MAAFRDLIRHGLTCADHKIIGTLQKRVQS